MIHIYLWKSPVTGHYEITFKKIMKASDVTKQPVDVLSSIGAFTTAIQEVRKLAKSFEGNMVYLTITSCGKKHNGRYYFTDDGKMWRR